VIGEGEFGKVLKAQAIDIPGTKGIIIQLIYNLPEICMHNSYITTLFQNVK